MRPGDLKIVGALYRPNCPRRAAPQRQRTIPLFLNVRTFNSQGASLLLDLQFQGTTISRRVFGEAVLQETGIGNQFPVALPKVTGRQAAAVLQAQNLADFEGNDTGIGVAKFSGQGRTLSAEISAFGG